MFKAYAGISALLVFVILTSGCINIDPEAIAKANPVIQEFLREHPNADLRIIHYSVNESQGIIDTIREDCGKTTIEPKEFYLVNVTEPGYMGIAWVDWTAQTVECAYKTSYVEEPECVPHFKSQCLGEHVYWYDSCGNKEEKKEKCENGCWNGVCVAGNDTGNQNQCKSHAQYGCYENHVFWIDSCGHVEEKKEYCDNGCENGFCLETECYDSDGGKNFYKAGVAESGDQRLEDHCNSDGTLTEKYCDGNEIKAMTWTCDYGCAEGACKLNETNCSANSFYACHDGHVYWYDSCENIGEKKEYCEYGCLDGACVEQDCTPNSYYSCWEGDLFWYDSCDQKGAVKESCEYGCGDSMCLEPTGNPLLLMHFDEGYGSLTYDSSGNNHTGIINGSVWTQGISGHALAYDGINDYVDYGIVNISTQSFTITVWVKAKDNNSNVVGAQTIISNRIAPRPNTGLYLRINRAQVNNNLYFQLNDQLNYHIFDIGHTDVADDEWHQITLAVDRNANKANLYVDANIENQDIDISAVNGSIFSTSDLITGYDRGDEAEGFGSPFHGVIDELAVYNYARSPEQIMEDYLGFA